jgi:hypothetical protein
VEQDEQGFGRRTAGVHEHPPGFVSRIASLQAAIPKVMPLYEQAKKS